MLSVFMEHPERVFTRDQLMDLVWDEPESAADRTVDAEHAFSIDDMTDRVIDVLAKDPSVLESSI